ncbi:L-2-amino-thiazoline-4-carboxylic acid hydrolase [Virgibacillus sp. C22-A2]|uniref:L-2-amino-thiazoline-4-carboxylic acid hydrolase n=1 Tax=Virgibacillus tibetensis TaxID=3042313 RepID=A0ABU6KG06_9BACI|nr:L-2-amino-thiazoline-4-carboxylic acid hydrolase [Virgibacillus sp. C22-A2]
MSEQNKPLPSLSMYTITARLFTHLQQSIQDSFGSESEHLIQQGVEKFGYKEAKRIADQATAEGENHVLDQYIPADYDENSKYGEITIYALMAKLFAQVSKMISDHYGEEGKDAIREGVRTFGEQRGRGIAERAAHMGKDATIDNYLSHYDMGRSDLFEFESDIGSEVIEQTFTQCPFGQQWADDDMHEYGILYCQMIDPAVAKGYNPDFEVIHDKYVLKEGVCHFEFRLKDKQD